MAPYSSSVKEFREVDFGKDLQNLQNEYLDVYEGIQSDIVSSNWFDENSDISTTYLGQTEQKNSQNKLKVEESFPISESGYTTGKLLDSTKCQLLLDTGVSRSFMSKSFLYALQIFTHIAKVCSNHTKNTNREWTVH